MRFETISEKVVKDPLLLSYPEDLPGQPLDCI